MAVYEKWKTIKYGALTVGKDDTGYDVKLYGATSGAYLLWDESANALLLVGTASLTSAGAITITNATASTTTATGALIVTGGVGIAKGLFVGEVVSVGTVCQPDTSGGAALGTTALMWSNLFLASAGVINFNAGNMTITHSAGNLAVAGGTLTTAGVIVGTVATGLDFTGTYTGNVIDLSSSTHVPTGSNGPCLIRAGSYGTPITNTSEDQSGLVRLYMQTSADGSSYDRGVFVCLKSTGIKGIFPVAGLAEVLAQSGNGPTKVQAAQFICDLHTTDAKLAGLGGDATAGMYGVWAKITAIDGATCSGTARAAPIWVDNQLYGANAAAIGEEYSIFATTGGSKPTAFIGFETTSSGWSNFLSFDETSYDQLPIVDADVTGSTKKYLACNYNGTAYGIPFYSVA